MKWYHALCAACSLALFIPTLSFAQPGPRGGHGGPGAGPMGGPAAHGPAAPGHNNHKKGDRDRDDRGHGPGAGPMGHGPGPVAGPHRAPAPGPHHAPAPGPHHAPAPGPVHHHGPAVPPPPAHHYRPAPVFVHRHGYDYRHRGMHPDDFSLYLAHIAHITIAADRINYILSSRSQYWYTTSQVDNIIRQLPYESDRLNVACELFPRVVDPENWFIVFDDFSSSTNRNRLAACSR